MKEPKVSIIIVNFNGGSVFRNCLFSLKKIKYKNYELIVFDNGSSDGTEKYATIKSKKNIGFVGGNNKSLTKAKGKYILLLNNDTKVKPDLLNVLVDKMEKDETIGVIQPKIFLMDRPGYLDNAGSFFTKIGFLDHWGFNQKDGPSYNKEKKIFSAKGACMLIRREVISQIGLFDKDYFAYFEESDFCFRVWMSGYKVLYYPKTNIYHKVGFTTKRQDVTHLNYLYYRNRINSLIKNLQARNLVWILPLHIFISFGIAFLFLLRGRTESSIFVLRAIKWNFVNLGKTLKKRRLVQAKRKISDSEIFKQVAKPINWKKFFGDLKRIEKDVSSN